MPGWDRQAEHVGKGPGIAVGHRPGQLRDLGCKDRLRRHDTAQEGERAGVLRPLAPVEDEPVHEPAGEANPDPRAGDRGLRPPRRHRVVEQPVQMSMWHVHHYPGDRQVARWLQRTRTGGPRRAPDRPGAHCWAGYARLFGHTWFSTRHR